ncbi:hypothetical protein EOD23_05910 [Mesorhizobium sp. USDA-HM6]|nr:hypothetical protein EOD23_05910 [Mesorhizobium sp. USDA-HM6]
MHESFEGRKELMKDLEAIMQDSGVVIQPFWQSLYGHMSKKVQNYAIHQTFQMDLQKVLAGSLINSQGSDRNPDRCPSSTWRGADPLDSHVETIRKWRMKRCATALPHTCVFSTRFQRFMWMVAEVRYRRSPRQEELLFALKFERIRA